MELDATTKTRIDLLEDDLSELVDNVSMLVDTMEDIQASLAILMNRMAEIGGSIEELEQIKDQLEVMDSGETKVFWIGKTDSSPV